MLARDEPGTTPAHWVVVEIARATGAILAEAEAAGRDALAAAGGGRNRGARRSCGYGWTGWPPCHTRRMTGLIYTLVDIPGLAQPRPPPAVTGAHIVCPVPN
jgi:hypothetical protein